MRCRVLLVIGIVQGCLGGFAGVAAYAQTPAPSADGGSNKSINLGSRGWAGAEAPRVPKEREGETLQFSAKAGIASDYIYRGTTLSDRKPAVGAGIEATYRWLYAGATVASVKLPTDPSSEITVSGGVRPTLGPIEFDIGATYFAYPGETPGGPTNGIEYWEAAFRGVAPIGESIRIAAGYSWFGNQSLALGGFELPAYLNWQAGVTFSHKFLNIDLRYYDTNLSKENCYVFTGDPNAASGGRINPITNPDGLMSRWCSATLVAKLWFALN
jgi:hypothetical protein